MRVRLTQAGSHAQLTVANRGPLIEPEDLEHLFDRFYRTDKARSRQETGGYGLAFLSIAKSTSRPMAERFGRRATPPRERAFTSRCRGPYNLPHGEES